MTSTDQRHGRRSLHLPGYDYTSQGAYFVTICTRYRELILEHADLAHAVERTWWSLGKYVRAASGGDFVLMPNHIHGIIWLRPQPVGAQHVRTSADPQSRDAVPLSLRQPIPARAAPLPSVRRLAVQPGSLGAIVRGFKSTSTKRINALRGTPGASVWQRGYHERVIRDEAELERVRLYIADNPRRWRDDPLNPRKFRD